MITIRRNGEGATTSGSPENFTGLVMVDARFQALPPARASGAIVTFTPGARTDWHAHPLGQTLIVTAGVGRVQQWDGPMQEIRPGDVIWIPPETKHWHGAAPDNSMSHIAITELLDGKSAVWMEKVAPDQYG